MRPTNTEASEKMLECAIAGDFPGILIAKMQGGDLHYKDAKGRNAMIELAKAKRPIAPSISYGGELLAIASEIDATILDITDNGGGTVATWLAYRGDWGEIIEMAKLRPSILEHFCNYGSSVATLFAKHMSMRSAYYAVKEVAEINPAVYGQPVIEALHLNKGLSDEAKEDGEQMLRALGFTQ